MNAARSQARSVMDATAYIRRETAISVAINMTLSLLFFWLSFGGAQIVSVWGVGAYVFDFLPQGFMVGLMSAFAPGALATKALASGKVSAWPGSSVWPASLLTRALLAGIAGAALGVGGSAAILGSLGTSTIDWWPALGAKLLFGGMLAAVITPLGLRAALARR